MRVIHGETCSPLSLTEMNSLWSVIKKGRRLSIHLTTVGLGLDAPLTQLTAALTFPGQSHDNRT